MDFSKIKPIMIGKRENRRRISMIRFFCQEAWGTNNARLAEMMTDERQRNSELTTMMIRYFFIGIFSVNH